MLSKFKGITNAQYNISLLMSTFYTAESNSAYNFIMQYQSFSILKKDKWNQNLVEVEATLDHFKTTLLPLQTKFHLKKYILY